MGSILVRGLNQKTIEHLKEHARLNGRSLQEEVKALLERAAETFTKPRHDGCCIAKIRPSTISSCARSKARGSWSRDS
jgi:plasmid stability protein